MENKCKHAWVANSGQGGEPEYKPELQFGSEPVMHVSCYLCGDLTWFTAGQWLKIAATAPTFTECPLNYCDDPAACKTLGHCRHTEPDH